MQAFATLVAGAVIVISSVSFSATAMQQQLPPPSVVATANLDNEQRALIEGERWFNFMQEALNTYSFSASLVYVQGQRVELFRWLRGYSEAEGNGAVLELLQSLNGPEVNIVRNGQVVSYFHAMASPYSLRSNAMFGPIPTAVFEEFSNLKESYYAVPMGAARVLERPAIHLRLLPHDADRFGYSLWIDRESGMLLRMATITADGDILEQLQVTALEVSPVLNPELNAIRELNPPPFVDDSQSRSEVRYAWQTHYLPRGFRQIRANHHRLPITGIAADYFLYSDGITRVSVYVSEDPRANTQMRYEGLESLYTHSFRDYSVTVVGRLPLETLQRIASSVQR